MRPVLIFAGSFLFWIAARGRFQKYADLVSSSTSASSSPVGASSEGGSGLLTGAADAISSIVAKTLSSVGK